jgi:hypothetical protein
LAGGVRAAMSGVEAIKFHIIRVVQKAAGLLIECLLLKDDLYDADAQRFADATLDSLKDLANGFDQESE